MASTTLIEKIVVGQFYHISDIYFCLGTLHRNKNLSAVKSYLGSGMGSLVVFLLCLECSPLEIATFICDKSFNFCVGDTTNNDIPTNAKYIKKLREKLYSKFGVSTISMQDFFSITGKYLSLFAYNSTKRSIEKFSYRTRPNVDVISVVRAATFIPMQNSVVIGDNSYYSACFTEPLPFEDTKEKTLYIVTILRKNCIDPTMESIHINTKTALGLIEEVEGVTMIKYKSPGKIDDLQEIAKIFVGK